MDLCIVRTRPLIISLRRLLNVGVGGYRCGLFFPNSKIYRAKNYFYRHEFDTIGEKESDVDTFDGKGLVGYLAPYSLALILSGLVTYAFIKHVLLDY